MRNFSFLFFQKNYNKCNFDKVSTLQQKCGDHPLILDHNHKATREEKKPEGRTNCLDCGDTQRAAQRPSLTHGDGETDRQSDANCLPCQSHGTTPPPVAMGNPLHHGNQLAVSLVFVEEEKESLFVML